MSPACIILGTLSAYLECKTVHGYSTVGNEDFRDVSLETQDGKPVVMSDTDREALVMGMTLHDKAQHALQKVRFNKFRILSSTTAAGTMILRGAVSEDHDANIPYKTKNGSTNLKAGQCNGEATHLHYTVLDRQPHTLCSSGWDHKTHSV